MTEGAITVTPEEQPDANAQRARWRWRMEIQGERFRWGFYEDGCLKCGERIGHFGGSAERDPCPLIPLDVPLEEVRPNCLVVRRYWIGDAIRAVCDAREKA